MTRESNKNDSMVVRGKTVLEEADLDEIMAAYDRLPLKLRELIDDAPVPVSAMQMEELLIALQGRVDLVYQYMYNVIKKSYPRWTPVRRRRG